MNRSTTHNLEQEKKAPATPEEQPLRSARPKLAIAVGSGWGVRSFLLNEALEVLKRRFDLIIFSPFTHLPEFRRPFEERGIRILPLVEPDRDRLLHLLFWACRIAHYQRTPTQPRKHKLSILAKGLLQRRESLKQKLKSLSELQPQDGPANGETDRGFWSVVKWRLHRWKRGLRIRRRLFSTRMRGLMMFLIRICGPVLADPLLWLYRARLARWEPVGELRDLFAREGVVGLFSTSINVRSEWPAVIAARANKIPVIAAVFTWDSPSTKPFLLCDFDGLLVWSPGMKEDMQNYLRAGKPERIHVVGAPHLDYLKKPEYQLSREEFCRPLGLDPARKIVVYSTSSPSSVPHEPELLCRFHAILERMPGAPQMLVRLHPKDMMKRYVDTKRKLEGTGVAWTVSGEPKREEGDQWCPDRDDIVRSVNTLRHGDVNVHHNFSTMILEFASQDKPVICIAYDHEGSSKLARFYQTYEHLRPIISSEAVRLSYSTEETERLLKRALESPHLDRVARSRLVQIQLGPFDGDSGTRACEAIVRIVDSAGRKPYLAATEKGNGQPDAVGDRPSPIG